MNNFISSLLWTFVGILLDRIFDAFVSPLIIKMQRKYDFWRAKRLYYSSKTYLYLKQFYNNNLSNCRIGNVSKQIAYLSHPDWEQLCLDVFKHDSIIKLVKTDSCNYAIRKKRLEARKRRGYVLDDNPSLFLHRIIYSKDKIQFEVGEYSYFQRISFTTDFEAETYRCAFFSKKRDTLRRRYLSTINDSTFLSQNTIPIGCDTVVAIKNKNFFSICVHKRTHDTVNYPDGIMVVPSFGFGSINNIFNPLFFSILREYCEELFDKKEMQELDTHVNPYWFYNQYPEVQTLNELHRQNKLQLLLTGCGFDVIGGFFNLETLLIINDSDASQKIFERSKGNWEGSDIKFLPIDSPVFEELLSKNKLAPTSAFAIQRAINILKNYNL